ncbi:MAG: hypothetical protein Q8L20_00985 [Gammaproteobacteria bacterium]|nr:hypothetical protein [Gammaproteobacteria bacterium]
MRLSFSRTTRLPHWLLALLLLMYVGQSVASVSVPCHLLSQETEEHGGYAARADHSGHDMRTVVNHHQHGHEMDHSAHGVGSPDSVTTSADAAATALHDCCDTMSHCGSGNCFMTSLDERVLYAPLNVGTAELAAAVDESPARPTYSLYRPPILR